MRAWLRLLWMLLLECLLTPPLRAWRIEDSLGTKAPYPHHHHHHHHGKKEQLPKTCDIQQVHLLSRHGTRFPTSESIKLFQRLEEYLQGRVDTRGPLAKFRNPYRMRDQGLLHPKGVQDMRLLAKRFSKSYGSLVDSSSVFIQSSNKPRTMDSANTFYSQLFNVSQSPLLVIDSHSDADLTPYKSCPLYNQTVRPIPSEEPSFTEPSPQKYFNNRHFPRIAQRLSKQNNVTLSAKQTQSLIEFCAFAISLENLDETSSEICSLFTQKDFNIYQLSSDMWTFYTNGYGHALNWKIMCSFITGLTDAMQVRIRNHIHDSRKNDSVPKDPSLFLRFAHAETVLPLLSFLDYRKGLFIRPKMSLNLLDKRRWVSSKMSPFSANVILELIHCNPFESRWFVRLRVNEIYTPIPKCSRNSNLPFVCDFKEFLSLFRKYVGCNFDEKCTTKNGTHRRTFGGWNGFGHGRPVR